MVFALVIGLTGWFLSQLAEGLAVRTGLRGGVIGALELAVGAIGFEGAGILLLYGLGAISIALAV